MLSRWRQYAEMAELGEIARRKFFNNCFDGALTSAGIVSGFLVIYLSSPQSVEASSLVITGLATALAIGISGLWGAFLSEEAERKKKVQDLKKDMVILDEEDEPEEEGLQFATPGEGEAANGAAKKNGKRKKVKKKKTKSLIERAEYFATVVASIVDGGAPALGSILPLVPFFFGASIVHFVVSYAILGALLVYLGLFLGRISGGGGAKYAAHLVTAGVVTLSLSLLLGAA